MDEPLRSGLYSCEVTHQRRLPRAHAFRYRLFFLDLDLDELPRLHRRLTFFSHNGFNLFSFLDRDHLDLGAADLRANLRAWLAPHGIRIDERNRVRIITLPRTLGYVFNPVSFLFIHDHEDRPVHAVAEVTNTFREVKPWLIPAPESPGFFHLTAPKHFYVSPFSSLTACFDFRIRVPDERIEIHIDSIEDGNTALVSWIRGVRRPITDTRLLAFAVRFPFLSLQVITKIHWQALRLWMKGLPFHRKHERPDLQRDRLPRGPRAAGPAES